MKTAKFVVVACLAGAAFKLYTLSAMDETMTVIGVREFKCT